jgi:hypothetical protein
LDYIAGISSNILDVPLVYALVTPTRSGGYAPLQIKIWDRVRVILHLGYSWTFLVNHRAPRCHQARFKLLKLGGMNHGESWNLGKFCHSWHILDDLCGHLGGCWGLGRRCKGTVSHRIKPRGIRAGQGDIRAPYHTIASCVYSWKSGYSWLFGMGLIGLWGHLSKPYWCQDGP